MATPNSMVALREIMTRDAFILNNILYQLGVLVRALFWVYQQPAGFVLTSTSMPAKRFEAAGRSRRKGNPSAVERDAQPADKGVAFPVSGVWFERSNLLSQLKQQGQERAFAKDLDAIGELIRNWRMDHQYPRAQLAREIDMPVDTLLFLETGSAISEDISKHQLQLLLQHFAHDQLGEELTLRAQGYLDKVGVASSTTRRGHSTRHRLTSESTEAEDSQEDFPCHTLL